MIDTITPDDSVITAYRAHGWTYLKGRTVKQVLAELTGKTETETKCCMIDVFKSYCKD